MLSLFQTSTQLIVWFKKQKDSSDCLKWGSVEILQTNMLSVVPEWFQFGKIEINSGITTSWKLKHFCCFKKTPISQVLLKLIYANHI